MNAEMYGFQLVVVVISQKQNQQQKHSTTFCLNCQSIMMRNNGNDYAAK
jgi:hypothetical protein